jgi:Nuclease-related domain
MVFPKKRQKNRPPVSGPLRRLPGQSVREELNRIVENEVAAYVFYAIAFWGLVAWEFARRWLRFGSPLGALVAVASLASIYCAWRVFRLRRDVKNLTQADKAERHVSDLLRRMRDKDYVTFDDLMDESAGWKSNIDHVVVGPGGLFAVETKGFSVFGDGYIEIQADGVLRLSGKEALKDPLGQAKSSAAKVSRHLEGCLHQKFWVHPVLVFPGWGVRSPKSETGVVVLSEGMIYDFFTSREHVFSNEAIRDICSHLDRSARD